MESEDQAFQQKLLATFRVEAREHVQALSTGLIGLEKAADEPSRRGIVESVFREAHSLKGAARAVDASAVEMLCHALESIFSLAQRNAVDWTTALLDLLHNAVDAIERLIASADVAAAGPGQPDVVELGRRLGNALDALAGTRPQDAAAAAVTPPAPVREASPPMSGEPRDRGADTLRISATNLEKVLLQIEGLLAAKLGSGQRMREFRKMHTVFRAWDRRRRNARSRSSSGFSSQAGMPSSPVSAMDFSAQDDAYFKSLLAWMAGHQRYAEYGFRTLGGMVDTLLGDMKKVLMLPFSSVLESFPKLVRDLARDEGKEVALQIEGAEIEIDRRILEEMKDPFIHLVRNSIHHGIESPDQRRALRKPPKGTLTFSVAQRDSGRIEIVISDDGAGVDFQKIVEAGQKLGMVSNPAAAANDEALALLFSSGVSTSPIITEISGRGLGLPIVKEKVEKLGGTIAVETAPASGTRFRIVLPLTLATFRGVEVRVGAHHFIFPTNQVVQCLRIDPGHVKTVENRESILFDGKTVALVGLSAALEMPAQADKEREGNAKIHAVVVGAVDYRIAFAVSELIEEQEVLVKGLGRQLLRVRNIAGAAILGSGKVVPVLNVPDLMKSATKAPVSFIAGAKAETKVVPSILVAEDSITTRTLLQGILESAGYRVTTAVDGMDAFTKLGGGKFDLLVSDVEMPRMDGFTLTARIRAEKGMADLPVILVTALASREHRERGVDAGANGYIVKSNFDQGNLLELIRRFV